MALFLRQPQVYYLRQLFSYLCGTDRRSMWTVKASAMKSQAETISELNARCDGPNQFSNFDRGVRASLSVSKETILKEEARQKRLRARRRAKKLT